MAFEGSCHCGAVTYTVEGAIPASAMSCNCSHCRRKGFLLAFIPLDQFRLTSGSDKLASYKFNKHSIDHQFCTECGCQGLCGRHRTRRIENGRGESALRTGGRPRCSDDPKD